MKRRRRYYGVESEFTAVLSVVFIAFGIILIAIGAIIAL